MSKNEIIEGIVDQNNNARQFPLFKLFIVIQAIKPAI